MTTSSSTIDALPWLESHHSFSFSRHDDPANTGHGRLPVDNEDTVRAGTGFSTHPHQDMEIVTWVPAGELESGDAVRLTAAGAPTLTADDVEGAEVLIWELGA